MAKQQREVWLSLETAQSALATLGAVVANELHENDRKIIDSLIAKARGAIDKAQDKLSDALRDAQNAIDRI